jgi:hypothetical protein
MRAAAATPIPGYTPDQLRSAYGLQSNTSGIRQTVAIVEPYDDPNAATDLAAYRTQFGLPPCTTSNGCFTKVNQQGAATPLPPANLNWAGDISTALDMVSAICPNCHLLLVEATTSGIINVGTGVNTAVSLGAKVITTSVAVAETSTDTTYDTDYFNHPGVAITAPAGNYGYGSIMYPAASQYVTAVGGTTLTQASGTLRGWTETPWNDSWGATGSGCSAYDPKPTWQKDTGCTTRTLNDVAADADPFTGVAVYDTYQTPASWQPGQAGNGVGGTGVAAAIIAGIYALAGTPAASTYPASHPYSHPGGSYTSPGTAYPYSDGLNDIASGSNGTTCSPAYLCTSGSGYDGPTGVGSPAFTTSFNSRGNLQGAIYGGITNKCLDDYQGSTANGNKVDTWACNTNASAQSWTVESDGTVRIGGSCLDVTNGGTSDGTKIQLWSCLSGDANQQWQPKSGGALVNPQSGKCLDDTGGSTTNGTQLQIYTCLGNANQRWTLPYTVPSATGAINYQANTAKCVDDFNNSTSDNNKIQVWDCLGDSAQNWTVAANGTLQINGRCMATLSDGTSDGTLVVLYVCTGDTNQQWIARSDGTLLNRRSGTCLDDPGGNQTNGTQLDITTCNQSSTQSWNLP